MYFVKIHFIDKEKQVSTRIVPLTNGFSAISIPNNLLFITIEDSEKKIRTIFLIKGRVEVSDIKEVNEYMFITLSGESWNWHLDCYKDIPIYIPSMYLMSRILRLLKKNRYDSINKLNSKIHDYCTEKKIKEIN